MLKIRRITILLLLACLLIGCFGGCEKAPAGTTGAAGTTAPSVTDPVIEEVDYAGQVKLNMSSTTAKTEATVKQFIDGDTTHFIVPTSVMPNGVLKARYLAINTPESTGKIEEWGKAAAAFT